MTVIATAGHVDHGKSTLVRTLTGTDPDRWAEEKRRGLTIDLGFAAIEAEAGADRVEFVDVPGHIRFLRNMLAGVGAISRCLFVVAADDGWKPQSEEHLRILELLGMTHGVIALTKIDRVDDETVELARMEIAEAVAGTFLEGARVVATDAPRGVGIEELRDALSQLISFPDDRSTPPRARLWIDRVFAAKGSGTVLTGTLTGASLATDDQVVIAPGDRRARIRAIEHHGDAVSSIDPGHRVALNVSGVAHGDVTRGDALVHPDRWHITDVVDASFRVLDSVGHPVSRRGSHFCYVGSGEIPTRVRVLGPDAIAPGESGFVRLRLSRELPLQPGDRFVLRDAGRDETVGGGEILDVEPMRSAATARPDASVAALVSDRGVVEARHVELLTGLMPTPDLGPYLVDPTLARRWREELAAAIEAAGAAGLNLAELDEPRRLLVDRLDGVVIADGTARPASAADDPELRRLLARLGAEPFAPPSLDEGARRAVAALKRADLAVESGGVVFSTDAVEQAARVIAALLADRPDGFSVAEARTAWGNTRKHAVPLLEVLDARGVTRRRDDVRIAGPRLPET